MEEGGWRLEEWEDINNLNKETAIYTSMLYSIYMYKHILAVHIPIYLYVSHFQQLKTPVLPIKI
jgi:hypothetical protein